MKKLAAAILLTVLPYSAVQAADECKEMGMNSSRVTSQIAESASSSSVSGPYEFRSFKAECHIVGDYRSSSDMIAVFTFNNHEYQLDGQKFFQGFTTDEIAFIAEPDTMPGYTKYIQKSSVKGVGVPKGSHLYTFCKFYYCPAKSVKTHA